MDSSLISNRIQQFPLVLRYRFANMSEHIRFGGYPLCIHIANEIKAYYLCGAIFEYNRNDSV